MVFKKRFDKFLVLISVIALAVTSAYLLKDEDIIEDTANFNQPYEIIAKVTSTSKDVRIKNRDQFSWQKAKIERGVNDSDKIFTGVDSTAEIEFNDKTKLKIDSRSLVIVEKTEGKLVVEMKYGTFTGVLGDNTKLTVVLNGEKKEIVGIGKKAKLNINIKPDGKTQIRVLQGKIALKSKDHKESIVSTNSSVKLNIAGEIDETISYQVLLESPKDQIKMWENRERLVKFSWHKSKKLKSYNFELSKTPDFSTLLLSKRTGSTSYTSRKLPVETTLYWRVANNNPNVKATVESRRFIIKENAPPKLKFPIDNEEIVSEKIRVHFNWSDKTGGEKYRFQVYNVDTGDQNYIEKIVYEPSLTIELPNGSYKWRVSTVDSNRPDNPWSEKFGFSQNIIEPQEEIAELVIEEPVPTILKPERAIASIPVKKNIVTKKRKSVKNELTPIPKKTTDKKSKIVTVPHTRRPSSEDIKNEPIKTEKQFKQSLFLALTSSVASISSVDSISRQNEKAVSSLSYGVTAVWTHLWSDIFNFFIVGSIGKFEFKMGGSRTLENNSTSKSYVGTGISAKLGPRNTLSFGAGLGQSFVLRSLAGGSSYSILKANIPALSLSARHNVIKFKSGFSFDLNWRIGALLASSQDDYKTETGYFYNIGIGSNYNIKRTILNISAGYTGREIKIGNATQDSKELGVLAGVGWNF